MRSTKDPISHIESYFSLEGQLCIAVILLNLHTLAVEKEKYIILFFYCDIFKCILLTINLIKIDYKKFNYVFIDV